MTEDGTIVAAIFCVSILLIMLIVWCLIECSKRESKEHYVANVMVDPAIPDVAPSAASAWEGKIVRVTGTVSRAPDAEELVSPLSGKPVAAYSIEVKEYRFWDNGFWQIVQTGPDGQQHRRWKERWERGAFEVATVEDNVPFDLTDVSPGEGGGVEGSGGLEGSGEQGTFVVIKAPPGKLGVTFTQVAGEMVTRVSPESALEGIVRTGDVLTHLDGLEIGELMGPINVADYLIQNAGRERELTFLMKRQA